MDDGTWHALAQAQHGLASRAQLREHGVTAEQLRWRLGRTWTLVLPPVVDVRGGPLTPERVAPPARAVVDAGRDTRTAREAAAIVIEAVQRGLATVEQIAHEVEAGARRGSASVRRAVGLAAAGAWSAPEAELLELCASSALLPQVWPNPRLRRSGVALVSPDAWIDDVGLALMVHSKRHHVREADWRATVEGDGELQEAGVVVLGFIPSSIAREPAAVLARIERTYTRLVESGHRRADVVMTPRGPGLER